MTRLRTAFTIVLPSMLAGGLLFGSAFGHAAASGGDLLAYWPAVNDVTAPGTAKAGSATRTPMAPRPPAPPPPPRAPAPPRPPKAPGAVQAGPDALAGIKDMVVAQLDHASAQLRNNPQIPKAVRDQVVPRLDRVRAIVAKRLSALDLGKLDQLDAELEKMGEEIEQEMAGLDQVMEQLGGKLGADLQRQLGTQLGNLKLGKLQLGNLGPTVGADFDVDVDVDVDVDDDDDERALDDLKDVALTSAQRATIARLRTESDKAVATARTQLEALSAKLEAALASGTASDAEIARYVDQISAHEATIRKVRLLAWVQARRVLDAGQRKKIEAAARVR